MRAIASLVQLRRRPHSINCPSTHYSYKLCTVTLYLRRRKRPPLEFVPLFHHFRGRQLRHLMRLVLPQHHPPAPNLKRSLIEVSQLLPWLPSPFPCQFSRRVLLLYHHQNFFQLRQIWVTQLRQNLFQGRV